MPILGADMDSGVLTRWLVAPGDALRRGDVVAVVGTDKSDIDVEVFHPGVVRELLVDEGHRVPVGTPIARIEPLTASTSATPEPPETPTVTPPTHDGTTTPSTSDGPQRGSEPPSRPRTVTSPVIRRLARRRGVDLAELRGSGPGGRVTREDVTTTPEPIAPPPRGEPNPPRSPDRPAMTPRARRLAAAAGRAPDEFVAEGPITADIVTRTLARPTDASARTTTSTTPADTRERARPTSSRRAIAALMEHSWREIPHFHVTRRVDLDEMMRALGRHNATVGPPQRLAPVAVILWAIARGARDVAAVNGWWEADGFRPHEDVDLAVVVARRGGGLEVVTLAAAHRLGPTELMADLDAAVTRVRAGRLRSSDVARASLTVTPLGDLGADRVAGVIHPPQVALVGLGRLHEAPVARGGLLGVAPVIDMTLSGDHRALDGLVASEFLERVRHHLDEFASSDEISRPVGSSTVEVTP